MQSKNNKPRRMHRPGDDTQPLFDNRRKKHFQKPYKKSEDSNSFFPPLALLESYEELTPGITQKVMQLVEQEQKHRQDMEIRGAQAEAWATYLGQILAFAMTLLVLYMGYNMAASHTTFALAISLAWFGLLILHVATQYRKRG